MAKEAQNPEQSALAEKQPAAGSSSFSLKKMMIIGAPLLIVQLVAIYFVVAKFAPTAKPAQVAEGQTATEQQSEASAPEIFVVKDLLVNPAGTNGTRYLLTTIGFEVSTAEVRKEFEAREVQIRDMLISILATKLLAELTEPEKREEIRQEIAAKARSITKTQKLTNVYFSKFIIQ